jgi:hypothetical protein
MPGLFYVERSALSVGDQTESRLATAKVILRLREGTITNLVFLCRNSHFAHQPPSIWPALCVRLR